MKFTDLFIRRPILAVSVSLLIVILGLQAISKLTVREYPEMTTTVISVSTTYAGADAELVQAFVTSTLEEAIAQADNIDYISSASRAGSSSIKVKMKLNTDPQGALADILSKVNSVKSQLPSGIDDPVLTSSAGENALLYLGFQSTKLTASQLADYIVRVVKPQIFTVEGVAKAEVFGSAELALRVWLDPQKLAAQNLSASTVMTALSNNNVQTAAGNDNGYFVKYANKVATTANSVEQLSNLVVYSDGEKLVRLSDVADIEMSKSSDDSRATANGRDAVVIAVSATSTANPLTVAKNVLPIYDSIVENLPESITSNILYNSTTAINNSIDEVVDTIVEATVIVLVVILMFIGSFRAIIIPVVTIPISLIGVLFILQIFGFSINLMTLLALILAIGLVVDDAIVVLENVDAKIKKGETPFRAAIIGMREIALPIISMTISLVAVYSPMVLMDGITGALFKEFALTLAGAVFISGVVALTLSPMMSSKLLKHSEESSWLEKRVESTLSKISKIYNYLLDIVMTIRKSVLTFAIVIFATVPFLLNSLSSELTPTEDKGGFIAMGSASTNVNVDYVQEASEQFQQIISDIPETGFTMNIAGAPASNRSLNIITLADWADRDRKQSEIIAELNAKAKSIPEMSFVAFGFPEIDTGEQGPPIGFVIKSPGSYTELYNTAQNVLDKMNQSGLFANTNLNLKYETPRMLISIDKEKAATYGITMQQISTTLGAYLSAATVTRVDIDGRAYKIIAQVKRPDRLSPESFNDFYVSATDGTSVPLTSLVSMKLESQPGSLPTFNQLKAAQISAMPMPGKTTGDIISWLEEEAKTLPEGYTYDFTSEARQQVQEGNALTITFTLAVVIIFLVLGIQFESIRDPLVIIVSVPLAVSGALAVLNVLNLFGVDGTTLNIYSKVGLITLIGLITKHGILMCEVAKEEQLHHGKNRIDAIIVAANSRLRPILMTTAAMVAGLVPLLCASGAGAVSRFSIGIVIVAGLSVGTLFTLFVLPVIYSYIASEHKPLPVFEENVQSPAQH